MTSFQDEFVKSIVGIGIELMDLSEKFQKMSAKDYETLYSNVAKAGKRQPTLIKKLADVEGMLSSLRTLTTKISMTSILSSVGKEEDPLECDTSDAKTKDEESKESEETKDTKEVKNTKKSKDAEEIKEPKSKETKEAKNAKKLKDVEDTKEVKETKEIKEPKTKKTKDAEVVETKDVKEPKTTKKVKDDEVAEFKEPKTKELKLTKKSKDIEDIKDIKDIKEIKKSKDAKDTKETKKSKDVDETKESAESDDSDNDENVSLSISKRRKKIPKHIRTLVWNEFIGAQLAQGRCFSCRKEIISSSNFHCGHVIAESKGGDLTIPNLRPICAPCNGAMGVMSMNEFTKTFFGWEV